MNLIDMHCDTLWKIIDLDKKGDLKENECSVNIPLMKEAGTLAQFFACFIHMPDIQGNDVEEKCDSGYEHVLYMADYLKKQAANYKEDVSMAVSVMDIEKNRKDHKISALLSVEEGGILNGKQERLDALYRQGIRLMTIMWNHVNCIGHPNSRNQAVMESGLKPFGIETIRRMNELGMMIDVSHASDGTIKDVIRYSQKPVIASHSNCRTVCDHPRNLSDEMIRALAIKGGVAGLNFYGPFLGTPNQSRIEEMVAHLKHMVNIGGSGFPVIGTDFDGFDGINEMEIPDTAHMELLLRALKKEGFTSTQIDKIWSFNALAVMKEWL